MSPRVRVRVLGLGLALELRLGLELGLDSHWGTAGLRANMIYFLGWHNPAVGNPIRSWPRRTISKAERKWNDQIIPEAIAVISEEEQGYHYQTLHCHENMTGDYRASWDSNSLKWCINYVRNTWLSYQKGTVNVVVHIYVLAIKFKSSSSVKGKSRVSKSIRTLIHVQTPRWTSETTK